MGKQALQEGGLLRQVDEIMIFSKDLDHRPQVGDDLDRMDLHHQG